MGSSGRRLNVATQESQDVLDEAGYLIVWWRPRPGGKPRPIPGRTYPHSIDHEFRGVVQGPFFVAAETTAAEFLDHAEKYYGLESRADEEENARLNPDTRFYRITAE